MKNKRLSKYLDGLDESEIKKILDDSSLESWRKNFIIRFYEQLSTKNLLKKDVSKNVTIQTDKHSLLLSDYKLPTSTLTECTNYNAARSLRTLNVNSLIAISNSLDVSIDYLLGIEECENHENTDIHKVIGLENSAIEVLKNNKLVQIQMNDFLINPHLLKIVHTIEHQKSVCLIYHGVSKEFSKQLFYKIENAYISFNKDIFPLDRSTEKYKEYLIKEINFNGLLEPSHINDYIIKNISKDLLYQFNKFKEANYYHEREIHISFITFITDYTFEIFENYHNQEQELLKISQSFLNIIKDYIVNIKKRMPNN